MDSDSVEMDTSPTTTTTEDTNITHVPPSTSIVSDSLSIQSNLLSLNTLHPERELTSSSLSDETFKIPELPSIIKGMPADIAHILALGLNEPDPAEDLQAQPTSNYEQVVRELKENAGFSTVKEAEKVQEQVMTTGLAGGERSDLAGIEEEMTKSGVPRPLTNVVDGEEEMEVKLILERDS